MLRAVTRLVLSWSMAAVLASLAVWLLLESLDVPVAFGIDDANIFFVYAKHLVQGHGLVYNVGGEHVEGFTSFLWMLVCAVAFALTSEPEQALLIFNVAAVAFAAACCVRSWPIRTARESARASWPWACAFLVLLFSEWRFVTWTTITLMDNALWSSALTLGALLAIDERRSDRFITMTLAGMAVVLTLIRPEAFVWVPVLIALTYVNRLGARQHAGARAIVRPALLAFVATATLLTAFRMLYFGFPLPNTFYAKVSPSLIYDIREGTKYLLDFAFASGPVSLLCVLAVILSALHLLAAGPLRHPQLLGLTSLAMVGLLLPVLTGGDHFVGSRFYQNCFPILLLTLLAWIRDILPRHFAVAPYAASRHYLSMMTATLTLAIGLTALNTWRHFDENDGRAFRVEFGIARKGRALGDVIRRMFDSMEHQPSVGTASAGGLKYSYAGEVIDLMGLNNSRMAHNGGRRIGLKNHAAFEKDTFFELQPAILLPTVIDQRDDRPSTGDIPWLDVVLKGLPDDARFHQLYEVAEVCRIGSDDHVALLAWFRGDVLSSIEASDGFVVRRLHAGRPLPAASE